MQLRRTGAHRSRAESSPRLQEHHRGLLPRLRALHHRNRALTPPPVSCSAAAIPCRRVSPVPPDHRSTSAETPRDDSRDPGTRSVPTSACPRAPRQAPPPVHAAEHPAPRLSPIPTLGEHPRVPVLPCARSRRPWRALGAQASRSGELRGRRAALAVEEPVPSPAPPVRARQWTTHATAVLHGQTPVQISPRSAGSFNAGEAPPRRTELRRVPPPPARPNALSRTISNGRSRLDLAPFRSEPPDLNPTDQI